MFTLREAAGLDRGLAEGLYPDLADGMAEQILNEATNLAHDVLDPLNRIGDKEGCRLVDGQVTTPTGWVEAYRQWQAGGWSGLTAPVEEGGMGLPQVLDAACQEVWTSANMAFMLCPLLASGAIEAVARHGSAQLRRLYLPKMISGEWTATMNLTEPQAGSDLSALRTRAERSSDGTYRIKGQKIYITYGEHDLTDNIIHLVLARLPDAPQGTRGISLFLVPKILLNPDGTLGARNDLRCHGLEHKMGIHGSPTCTMIYGDQEGAIGWLIGEENRGLACMFTMMNAARLGVGLQGVAIAERASQKALSYARERRQGRAAGSDAENMSPIIHHPDISRSLMMMKSLTAAARAICYLTAAAIDRGHRGADESMRKANAERAALLTPLAKAFATDVGIEVANIGIQVHGGMGFIEETGAAQLLRDVRIAAIYEGTNGIQAIDLVQRKLTLNGGAAMRREIADMRLIQNMLETITDEDFGTLSKRLAQSIASLESASQWLLATLALRPQDALAGANAYLRLFALARGCASLTRLAIAGRNASDPALRAYRALARFFGDHVAVEAKVLEDIITSASDSLHAGAGFLMGDS
jgi:alkylation response protein AidB-like acyl-CoA dehydrogenase